MRMRERLLNFTVTPRQFRIARRPAAMSQADPRRIFHLLAEMPVQRGAQFAVAGHVDQRHRSV